MAFCGSEDPNCRFALEIFRDESNEFSATFATERQDLVDEARRVGSKIEFREMLLYEYTGDEDRLNEGWGDPVESWTKVDFEDDI